MSSYISDPPFGRILLLWCAGLGAAAQYAKISVIYDQLPQVYPNAGAALGFVVSIVGFVGIVFGVVAGVLVARLGYRRTLIWALLGGAILSGLQAFLPPLWVMLTLRVFEGMSHLAIVVAAPTLIAQLSAPRHRGFTLTLWGTVFGVTYSVLVWLGLPMVAALGIPSLFLAHAVWMVAIALILLKVLPKIARSTSGNGAITIGGVLSDHTRLYRSPFTSAAGVGWLFYTFCFLALLTLLPPFIADDQRARILVAMPLVSIVVSLTAGVLMLRFFSAVQVVVIGFALVIATLCWLVVSPGGAAPCIALAGAFGLVQGASFAAVPQLNTTPQTQALANGAMAQMGNIGNTLGTPVLAAVLLGTGYSGMVWTSICVTIAGLIMHAWMARRRAYFNV